MRQIHKQSVSKTSLTLLGLMLITLAFFMGYFIGGRSVEIATVPDGEGRVVGKKVPVHLQEDVAFDQFWNVWNFAKESFYKQPVSDKDLYFGSMKGLLSGLNDPYSVFFDPEEANMFMSSLEGTFQGIGAEIGLKDDKLQIIAPLDNSPAQKAGLQPGDWIVSIDEFETMGMTIEEAVTKIRGEKGSTVELGISKNGLGSVIIVPVVLDDIVIDSVKWEIDENKIIHISVSTFNQDTNQLFNEAIQEALSSNVSGVILDLRSNPGGLLTSAIDMASAWIGYDAVVIERAKDKAKTFKGVKSSQLVDTKTVVLINGGSASGSEIVAGALQDYKLATLVGTQTFGKGSVQEYRRLKDGSAVKITTAEWYTPNGRSINEEGVSPDIEIAYSLEEFKDGKDPQKDTAVAIILGTYEEPEDKSEEITGESEEK